MASICLVAGDPSGDAHAAKLIEALKTHPPTLTFAGLGGPAMQRAGMTLLQDLTTTAAIGPFDATRHIGALRHSLRVLEEHLTRQRPDLVLLVDFGDFNLPFVAPLVKRHRIPILYYISPQLWAWGRFRMRSVKQSVDRMLVFFQFEETFYQQAGVPVTWVGHPLIDEARPSLSRDEAMKSCGLNPWRRTVGLLPGSRERELERHLPLMLKAAQRIAWRMPGVQFVLPKAPALPRAAVDALLQRAGVDVCVAEGSVYDALQLMEAAIVASGTATLEAALCEIPMVVVYRTSWPTYLAAKAVIRVPRIGLVNIVAGRHIVPEFVQHRARPRPIGDAIVELMRDDERCETMKAGLREVKTTLGPGGAVNRAAAVVLDYLRRV